MKKFISILTLVIMFASVLHIQPVYAAESEIPYNSKSKVLEIKELQKKSIDEKIILKTLRQNKSLCLLTYQSDYKTIYLNSNTSLREITTSDSGKETSGIVTCDTYCSNYDKTANVRCGVPGTFSCSATGWAYVGYNITVKGTGSSEAIISPSAYLKGAFFNCNVNGNEGDVEVKVRVYDLTDDNHVDKTLFDSSSPSFGGKTINECINGGMQYKFKGGHDYVIQYILTSNVSAWGIGGVGSNFYRDSQFPDRGLEVDSIDIDF